MGRRAAAALQQARERVARCLGAQPGETLRLRGRWGAHPQHGRQFHVEDHTTVLPATVQGIRRYLGSGLVPGIGPRLAERIVDHLGADALRVIESTSREALTDIAQIRKTVDRASEYARQLLAFGRREVARPVRHDISRTVADVYALLSHSLGDDITLSTNAHQDLPPVVVDPGQLEQTLVNLALNARDAMPHGGRLSITAEPCTKSAPGARPSRHVKIRVTDTGAGMPPEVLERAFEPFFTTKDPVSFAGMGLAVAHGMVTAAGGEINIASDPGRGTTVVIMLPADDVLEPRRAPDETVPGNGAEADGRRTILVVDDEPDLRDVVRRMLGKSGYDVITAADGNEAMEKADAHTGRIDLLITDIMMPEMSGTELAEQLREVRDGMPVLFMSGYAAPVLAEKGTLDPGTVLLQKPFRKQELVSAVENLLSVSV